MQKGLALIMMYENCSMPGCNNRASTKADRPGHLKYHSLCSTHRRRRRLGITHECAICGWQGLCDVHRRVFGKEGGEYTKNNTISICPNCHRLLHGNELCIVRKGSIVDDNQLRLFELR